MSHGIRCTSSADQSDSQAVVGLDFVHHKGAFKGGDRVQAAKDLVHKILVIFHVGGIDLQQIVKGSRYVVAFRYLGTKHIDDIIADLEQALDRI